MTDSKLRLDDYHLRYKDEKSNFRKTNSKKKTISTYTNEQRQNMIKHFRDEIKIDFELGTNKHNPIRKFKSDGNQEINNNLIGKMPNFINNYNELMNNLQDMMNNNKVNKYKRDKSANIETRKFYTGDISNAYISGVNKKNSDSPLKNLLIFFERDSRQELIDEEFSFQISNEINYPVNKKKKTKNMNQAIQAFLSYSKHCLKAIKKVKKPSIEDLENHFLHLPLNKEVLKIKKVAVFGLDETLVHFETREIQKTEVVLNVNLPNGQKAKLGLNIRPFLLDTLKEVSKDYIIIVYTASNKIYADAALDYIDPENKFFKHRLYRENCLRVKLEDEYIFVKDLRILKNINLKNAVIIDNSILSFSFQLNNGIPILPYHSNKDDDELIYLLQYLKHLVKCPDVREENIKNFNLKNFCSEQECSINNKYSLFENTESEIEVEVSVGNSSMENIFDETLNI